MLHRCCSLHMFHMSGRIVVEAPRPAVVAASEQAQSWRLRCSFAGDLPQEPESIVSLYPLEDFPCGGNIVLEPAHQFIRPRRAKQQLLPPVASC